MITLQKPDHILVTLFHNLFFIHNNMPFIFFHLSKNSSAFCLIKILIDNT